MQKMYKCGFYGGKFLPFHKGHKFCIRYAAQQCERLVVILFSNSEEEIEICRQGTVIDSELLKVESRASEICAECDKYPNVEFHILNCEEMHRQALLYGTDTWDAETPYVMKTVGSFQAVYSSEPG